MKYFLVKFNYIFKDRPVDEVVLVCRDIESQSKCKTLLNSMGLNPCPFNCYEILN